MLCPFWKQAQNSALAKPAVSITKEIIASFKDVANDIKDHVSQNKSITILQENNEAKEQNDDMLLADEVLANIHAKAMNKIVKDTSGTINYREEQQTGNTINKNISELESLI